MVGDRNFMLIMKGCELENRRSMAVPVGPRFATEFGVSRAQSGRNLPPVKVVPIGP